MNPGQHAAEGIGESGIQVPWSTRVGQRSVPGEELQDEGGRQRIVVELARQGRTSGNAAGRDQLIGPNLSLESPSGLGVDGLLQKQRWDAIEIDPIKMAIL